MGEIPVLDLAEILFIKIVIVNINV